MHPLAEGVLFQQPALELGGVRFGDACIAKESRNI